MSLKDEIDKLIRAEREHLEQRDAKEYEFDELQKARFLPLRAFLEQVIKAVDPAYLRLEFKDHQAIIEVGKHWDNGFEVDIRWCIEPMSTARAEAEAGEALFEAQPGFSTEEVETFRLPEFKQFEHTYTFETEEEVVQHILKRMAEYIAHYQYIEETTRNPNSNDPVS